MHRTQRSPAPGETNRIITHDGASLSTSPERVTASDLKHNRAYFAALVLGLYVVPVVLLLVDVIPFSLRFVVLLAMAGLLFVIERLRRRDWHELGFRKDNLRRSLRANTYLSVGFGLAIGLGAILHGFPGSSIHGFTLFYPFYVLISSPSQEYLFRSVIFCEMNRSGITGRRSQVLLSTAIYTFPHTIYHSASTVIVVAFIGLIWGAIYYRLPNWYGVALSHSVLGALSIAVGIV
jgi:hypothetical protein